LSILSFIIILQYITVDVHYNLFYLFKKQTQGLQIRKNLDNLQQK